MRITTGLLIISMLFITGCAGGPYVNEETGIVAGAAVGAGTGAAVGSTSGNAGTGALIGGASGAVVGGVTGAVIDRNKESEDEDLTIRRQKKELQKQQSEREDIERQRHYDEKLENYLEKHQ